VARATRDREGARGELRAERPEPFGCQAIGLGPRDLENHRSDGMIVSPELAGPRCLRIAWERHKRPWRIESRCRFRPKDKFWGMRVC
jgi:hypothetical protein